MFALLKACPPKMTPARRRELARLRTKAAREIDQMIKEGCTCEFGAGRSSMDPRCPLHGLSAYRRDNDRR